MTECRADNWHIGFILLILVNLARLLQSLDVDNDPDNGIVIDDMAHTMASGLTLDFEAATFDADVVNLVANSGSNRTALLGASDALSHLSDTLGMCANDHALVGRSAEFSNNAHGIGGIATVTDNCTIEITMFNYDGGGSVVYFYAGVNRDFSAGSSSFALSNNQLNGQQYSNANITIKVPTGKTIADFNSISVWCVQFQTSFGDLRFSLDN